jgi:hypothetical protein
MSSEEFNSHTIFAIISGILLTISEILPFISKIESKGLVHFLINAGNRLLAKENSEETEPLLPIYNEPKSNVETGKIAEPKDEDDDKETKRKKHGKDSPKKTKKRANVSDANDTSDKNDANDTRDANDETEDESEPVQKFLKRKRNDVRNKKNKVTEGNKTRYLLKTSEEYELDFLKNYIVTRYLDHIVILPSLHLCNKERFENMGYKVFYDHIDDKYTLKW